MVQHAIRDELKHVCYGASGTQWHYNLIRSRLLFSFMNEELFEALANGSFH